MLLLSANDIKNVFTMRDAISSVKEAFVQFSSGKSVVPLRTQIPVEKHNGVLLFMPAYAPDMDAGSVKIVNIFPKNAECGKPTAPAQVLYIDAKDGMIKAVLDGTLITQMRTGAATGLAFELFSRKDAKIGALIGTGSQARMQLEAMIVARKLDEVRIFSRNFENTTKFVDKMRVELSHYNVKFVASMSSDDAIDNADLIVAVTSSNTPVYDGNKVKNGATVSFVGSYQPHTQEMDSILLKRAGKIYFDSKDAVLSESGDILIPLADGIINHSDFTGDIGDAVLGKIPMRENDDEIIVFKTVGIGMQDLVTAKDIYERAKASGVGTVWGEQ